MLALFPWIRQSEFRCRSPLRPQTRLKGTPLKPWGLRVLSYIYTGMFLPTGSWFWDAWSRTGYLFRRRFQEQGYDILNTRKFGLLQNTKNWVISWTRHHFKCKFFLKRGANLETRASHSHPKHTQKPHGEVPCTMAIHKEESNFPLKGKHKELYRFQKLLKSFTELREITRSKVLGENPEVTIARVRKAGSGVEAFSLRTQDA